MRRRPQCRRSGPWTTRRAPADRIALGALDAALVLAREAGEDRPALEILAGSLAEMGVRRGCHEALGTAAGP